MVAGRLSHHALQLQYARVVRGTRGRNDVRCQLKFWLFVSTHLNFRFFVSCQLMIINN